MALAINNNPMNPVPLWSSKTYWQCRQKTFHDAMAWPVLPTGHLPLMALTVTGDMPTGTNSGVTATITNCGYSTFNRNYAGRSVNAAGTSVIELVGYLNPEPGDVAPVIEITPTNSIYTMKIASHQGYGATKYTVHNNADDSTQFSRELLESGNSTFYVTVSSTKYTFNLSAVDLQYRSSIAATIALKNLDDDSTVGTAISQTILLDGILPYYTPQRCAQGWLGGQTLEGNYTNGVYYLDVTVDGTHYYSEPFMWLSSGLMSGYTIVTYRRSDPVIMTDNYISFVARDGQTRSLSAYLPNIKQRPPFQFDVEVTEIDGRKFAEKQVSYRKDHLAFNCYEAFVEAIRLLWHCDIRNIAGKRVDYMEPPEVDWSNDNHLCDVTLDFESDTVMQTNGTASAYGDSSDYNHSSYDNSFDNSFE